MKLTHQLREAIRSAIDKAGGHRAFAKECGIDYTAPGRWLRKADSIDDDNWEKIRAAVKRFLPYETAAEIRDVPAAPGPHLDATEQQLLADYRNSSRKRRSKILALARESAVRSSLE